MKRASFLLASLFLAGCAPEKQAVSSCSVITNKRNTEDEDMSYDYKDYIIHHGNTTINSVYLGGSNLLAESSVKAQKLMNYDALNIIQKPPIIISSEASTAYCYTYKMAISIKECPFNYIEFNSSFFSGSSSLSETKEIDGSRNILEPKNEKDGNYRRYKAGFYVSELGITLNSYIFDLDDKTYIPIIPYTGGTEKATKSDNLNITNKYINGLSTYEDYVQSAVKTKNNGFFIKNLNSFPISVYMSKIFYESISDISVLKFIGSFAAPTVQYGNEGYGIYQYYDDTNYSSKRLPIYDSYEYSTFSMNSGEKYYFYFFNVAQEAELAYMNSQQQNIKPPHTYDGNALGKLMVEFGNDFISIPSSEELKHFAVVEYIA